MSGSPKHTYAQLREMELEEERRRRREEAAREAEQRRQEAERLARQRLSQAVADASRYAGVVTAELSVLFEMPLSEYISREVVLDLQRAAQQAATAATAAPDETAARAGGRTLQQILDRVRKLNADATHTHGRRAELLTALDESERAFAAAAGGELAAFLGDGVRDDLRGRLRDLRGDLTATRSAEKVRAAGEAHAALNGEINRAVARAKELHKRDADLQAKKGQAEAAAAEAAGELAALRADVERAGFVARHLSAVDASLARTTDLLRAERYDEALAAAKETAAEVRRLAAVATACVVGSGEVKAVRAGVADAQPPGRSFDAVGAAELGRLLGAAETALKAGTPDAARDALDKAKKRLDQHRQVVAGELAAWQVQYDKADAALSAAGVQFAGLQADPVAVRWNRPGVDALGKRLEAARAALDAGRLADVHTAVGGVPADITKLVDAAQPLELQSQLQHRLMSGVVQVMDQMGYNTTPPTPEFEGDPKAALLVQAHSPSTANQIAVTVEHEGRIEYEIGGALEKHVGTAKVGRIDTQVKTCHEGEAQLLKLHEFLLALGIETDGLHWDDKPPPGTGTAVAAPRPWGKNNPTTTHRPNPTG